MKGTKFEIKYPKYLLQDNRSGVKWGIVSIAILIGLVSVFYTNLLVEDLLERERQQIKLFAEGLKFLAKVENSETLTFLMDHIIEANHIIPVIETDDKGKPLSSRNIEIPTAVDEDAFLRQKIEKMKLVHEPILIQHQADLRIYIYYDNSILITQLKYFPYVQLTVILIFFVLVYFIFMSYRRAEQNSIWAGLAKETAHQLGTPLSSLMAWIEHFRLDEDFDQEIVIDLEKDVQRLEMITERFSHIGSIPIPKTENIFFVISNIVHYLKKRVSTKTIFQIHTTDQNLTALIDKALFEWVIENLCKNAVDSTSGIGSIDISISLSKDKNKIQIDIKDSGKGIPPNKFKTIFRAGYTTKRRGWGLGLTLVKRIVEEYHKGKIFVLKSELNVGTTFRIFLPKEN